MENYDAYRYHSRCCSALLGLGLNPGISPRLLAGVVLAMLPDADVLAFVRRCLRQCFRPSRLYPFTAVCLRGADTLRTGRATMVQGKFDALLAVLTVSLLSHSLLDSVTTDGKGVGWLWPWSDERFFAPWQVIKRRPVCPVALYHAVRASGDYL